MEPLGNERSESHPGQVIKLKQLMKHTIIIKAPETLLVVKIEVDEPMIITYWYDLPSTISYTETVMCDVLEEYSFSFLSWESDIIQSLGRIIGEGRHIECRLAKPEGREETEVERSVRETLSKILKTND